MDNKIKILKKGDLGRKKEKKVFFPKGRVVDENAEKEIILLLKNKSKGKITPKSERKKKRVKSNY